MSHLVVLGLDNREDAERVLDLTGDLAKQQLLQLQDAAYAYKDDKALRSTTRSRPPSSSPSSVTSTASRP